MKKTLFFLVLIFQFSFMFGQDYTSSSRKAIKNYEKALAELKTSNYSSSLEYTKKAIEIDDKFIEVYLLQADIYQKQRKFKLEMQAFLRVVEIDKNYFPKSFVFLAELQLKFGKYTEALKSLHEFSSFKIKSDVLQKKAKRIKEKASFGEYNIQHPVKFDPQNLGAAVNTKYNDYWPSLTVDETQLFTTVKIPVGNTPGHYREDLHISYNETTLFTDTITGKWKKAEALPKPLTTSGNEGACSISSDGRILFFTRCTCPDGIERCCDIYYSIKQKDSWSKARKIPGYVNTGAWEAQPSISSLGTEIYFTSNRKGGKGKQDIWMSFLDIEKGIWGRAINLGDSINTKGNEMSPFIHPDNQTLYFSSDNWLGMGGFDLFISRKKENNKWTKPQNLGFPINTFRNELGLISNSRGNLAYFSSDRMGAENLDIYSFELPEKIRPIPVKYIKGRVIDAQTKKALQAKFTFVNEKTEKELLSSYSNAYTGDFFISLPVNKNYLLNVHKSKYLFYSSNFLLEESKNPLSPLVITVELQPIKAGEIIILENIFFKTASYTLLKKSDYELDKLYKLLNDNKNITKVEIRGHTDNEGTEVYNLSLSENRAKAVFDYLLARGIDSKRLSYKGYGFEIPIDNNKTKEGRAKNRRTEFKIIESTN